MEVYCLIHNKITTLTISNIATNAVSKYYEKNNFGELDLDDPNGCKLCGGLEYWNCEIETDCCGSIDCDGWVCCQPSIVGKIEEKFIINRNKDRKSTRLN